MRVLLLLLFSSLSFALKDSKLGWWKNETTANYQQWPDSVQARLDREWNTYKNDKFPLPTLRVFQTFPENTSRPLPWALLNSINTRLHPVLWPRVHYALQEGTNFGCRTPDDQPVTSAHCHRHCIHQGRYCLDHVVHDDGETVLHGSSLLKEITRRQCMDSVYRAKDPRFIQYVHEFQQKDCLWADSLRNCSITALLKVGMHWSELEGCVAENLLDQDLPHETLDRNLRHLNMRFLQLPKITINDDKTIGRGRLRTATIFSEYCQAFPSYQQQPLACHVCKDCGNVRECLWNLQCDGEPFEAGNVEADVLHGEVSQHETEEPTEPPQEEDDGEAVEEQKEEEEDELDTHAYSPDVLNDLSSNKAELEQQHQQPQVDTESDGHGGILFWVIFLFFVAMTSVAFGLYYHQKFRHERAAKLLADIAAGKYTNGIAGLYRDNPEDEVVNVDVSLGGRQADDADDSERDYRGKAQKLLNAINEGSYRSNSSKDLLDTLPNVPRAQGLANGVFEDEGGRVQVEDVSLDEESEWATTQQSGSGIVAEKALMVDSSTLV